MATPCFTPPWSRRQETLGIFLLSGQKASYEPTAPRSVSLGGVQTNSDINPAPRGKSPRSPGRTLLQKFLRKEGGMVLAALALADFRQSEHFPVSWYDGMAGG